MIKTIRSGTGVGPKGSPYHPIKNERGVLSTTIEEIDLYKLNAEDLEKYLPTTGCASCGARNGRDLAKALLEKKVRAVDCNGIEQRMAEAIDSVLSIDVHLPESDPMMQKVPEKLLEHNSPGPDSPS